MMRVLGRSLMVLVLSSLAYLAVLAYPQPLFAHAARREGLTVHSSIAIPDEMWTTLDRALTRLQRSPVYASAGEVHVFICDAPPLFALFARQNYRVGGIADWLVGQHVFLRESDLTHDRLISPSGTPVAADRPLSYFIAHEAMHIAITRYVGRSRYSRLPQWVDDGYADYVARDIDYARVLQQLKENARELDPARSGLYLRYHLMVAYLIEKKGLTVDALFAAPPAREAVETELAHLASW